MSGGVVRWAMVNSRVVLLIVCCLIAFGVYGLRGIKKNEFPDFTIRQGIVVAVCPGMSITEVEDEVTKPLEDYIFGYKEVLKSKTKSVSRHGVAIIQIELNADLQDKDVFWNKFKHGLSVFRSSLPSSVLAVQVNDDFGDTSAILLTLESDSKTYRELGDIMSTLQDHLRGVEEIGRMTVLGERQEQVSIYVDYSRLAHYGIPFESIATTLYTKGFTTLSGSLRQDDYTSPIRVAHSMNVEGDIESVIVYASPTGEVVTVGDIAEVRREYAPLTSVITNNGVKSLLLSIEVKKGRSITDLGSKVDDILAAFAVDLPKDVTFFKITDQPQVVGHSVTEFLMELLIAICAVMVVVVLLLPWRVASIASATIPITIFISLGLFYALDIELNTVTLAALIVTLGMIVDNSIVIVDAYTDALRNGVARQTAAINSAQHFFRSILTATLAISITFFPLLITITGTFRDFLQAFPYAITIVLAVSLAVAELLVPYLLYRFVRVVESPTETSSMSWQQRFDHWLQGRYNAVLSSCFRHPWVTLTTGIATIVVAALCIPIVPMRLMPVADRDQFAIEVYLPTGTPIAHTIAVADSLESLLRDDPEIVSIAAFKGCSSPRFQMGYAPQIAGENYAQFVVNTVSNSATERLLDKYSTLNDAFPEAYIRFKQLAYGVEENAIEVRVSGDDWSAVQHYADTIAVLLRQRDDLWIVRTDANEPLMTTVVTLDEVRASRLAVTNAAVQMTLATRYTSPGIPIGTIWDGDYDYPIMLTSAAADSATVTTLQDELVPVMGGLRSVPLRDLATVRQDYEPGQLPHRNGLPTITVKADTRRGENTTRVTRQIVRELSEIPLQDGVTITYGGEQESNEENLPKIFAALAISVVIIFFLLVAHYKRVTLPVVLLFSLLLTLFGTVASVFIQGCNFGVTSFLGVISLMGILVRNAIIMYDYANELRAKEGMDVKTAIMTSAQRRMHPIFLTSMAASMGVIPMILGGSGLWQPMGVIICYGTLITMLLILTILPIAYWKLTNES